MWQRKPSLAKVGRRHFLVVPVSVVERNHHVASQIFSTVEFPQELSIGDDLVVLLEEIAEIPELLDRAADFIFSKPIVNAMEEHHDGTVRHRQPMEPRLVQHHSHQMLHASSNECSHREFHAHTVDPIPLMADVHLQRLTPPNRRSRAGVSGNTQEP